MRLRSSSGDEDHVPARTLRSKKSLRKAPGGPESSPLGPTPAGLTPDPPRKRRASAAIPPSPLSFQASASSHDEHVKSATAVRATADRQSRLKRQRPRVEPCSDDEEQAALGQARPAPPQSSASYPEARNAGTARATRAKLPQRGRWVSAPDVPQRPPKVMTEMDINRSIQTILEDGPKPSKGSDEFERDGYNYCFLAKAGDAGRGLIKLGISKNDPRIRKEEINKHCKFPEICENRDALAVRIKHYKLAEKLMHAELLHLRAKVVCGCKNPESHHEFYYESDKDAVIAVFRRWRLFCDHQPWDENGNLHTWWQDRLKMTMDAAAEPQPSGMTEIQRISRLWTNFVAASVMDHLLFDAKVFMNRAWPVRWKIVAFGQAVILTLSTRSGFSLYWMILIVAILFWEAHFVDNVWTAKIISKHLGDGGIRQRLLSREVPTSLDSEGRRSTETPIEGTTGSDVDGGEEGGLSGVGRVEANDTERRVQDRYEDHDDHENLAGQGDMSRVGNANQEDLSCDDGDTTMVPEDAIEDTGLLTPGASNDMALVISSGSDTDDELPPVSALLFNKSRGRI